MKRSPVPSQTFLLLSLALVIYLFYAILRPFLVSLIVAMTLGSLFYPNFLAMKRAVGGRAGPVSLIMCSIITILIIIPLVLLFSLCEVCSQPGSDPGADGTAPPDYSGTSG